MWKYVALRQATMGSIYRIVFGYGCRTKPTRVPSRCGRPERLRFGGVIASTSGETVLPVGSNPHVLCVVGGYGKAASRRQSAPIIDASSCGPFRRPS